MNEEKALVRAMRKKAEKFHEKEPAYTANYNRETLMWLVFALLLALGLRCFVLQLTRVDGDSMFPTFYTDEQVFVEKISYMFTPPQRGQVIICRYTDNGSAVIKRVIGLPGETVSISGGRIYIDGKRIDESAYWNDLILDDMEPFTVPEENVFVVGDNRNASLDSRITGPVPYYRIIGRVRFVVWPFESFGRFAQ